VRRLPPTTRHFLGQRVRQAYDELARPHRLAASLLVLPLSVALTSRRPASGALLLLSATVIAELGRRRGDGRRYFPATSSLLAPLWVVERGVCAWVAVGARLRGGVRYRGKRIRCAAHSMAELRNRYVEHICAHAPADRRDDEGSEPIGEADNPRVGPADGAEVLAV
jgi:hypothetical protein